MSWRWSGEWFGVFPRDIVLECMPFIGNDIISLMTEEMDEEPGHSETQFFDHHTTCCLGFQTTIFSTLLFETVKRISLTVTIVE